LLEVFYYYPDGPSDPFREALEFSRL